ncbi:hypothetical protein BDB00DRAFT_878353 [Zychaea mexicana]|uniref:uncharacterized protein n=1 Tax=Zychaea mexicana TaxID=64656 RepID=UPI0022FE8C29|nr:uncharacterized protein BDB00DRAFT_878353 [Zychaea mexicana]KAI9484864.1 hypothetical protein BDB00DRAFT_878353 [Zychaea mexicana]
MGRSKTQTQCGNPLWRDWIKEWAEEIRQSKAYYTYIKAHNALANCQTVFTHPSETIQLKGIGEGLAGRLERRLQKYCEENGLPMPERPSKSGTRKSNNGDTAGDDGSNASQQRKKQRSSGTSSRAYVPRYRTGGYAIMLSLLEHRERNDQKNVSREQIIRLAEDHCDSSFDLPEPGKSYTAWSGIKTLMTKDYVWKHGSPATYTLTDTGLSMAKELKSAAENGGRMPRSTQASSSTSSQNKGKQRDRGRMRQVEPEDESSDNGGEEEVDLSLYVMDPDKYRASMANSVTQQQSSQQHQRNDCEGHSDGGGEKEVDLSLYVMDPDNYRASMASSSTGQQSSQQQQRDSRASRSDRNDVRDISRKYEDNEGEEEPVDLSLYVTDKVKFRAEMASSAPPVSTWQDTSTQISLLDDDDDGIDLFSRSKAVGNEVFSRYQSPSQSPATNSLPLSYQLQNLNNDDIIALDSPSPQELPPSPLRTSSQAFLSSFPDPDDISIPESELGSQSASFLYTFLDQSNKYVRHISQAAVEIRGSRALYKIRFSASQLSHPQTDKIHDTQIDTDSNTYTGYIAEIDCDTLCPGLSGEPLIPLNREEEDDFWPSLLNAPETGSAAATPQDSQNIMDSQSIMDSQLSIPASQIEFEEYPPDSYDIVLVLDTREIKMRTNRDFFLQQLTEKGIRVVKRALELGDMLWIAQKKGSRSSRDELFLDFVVERKRLDDLVASIKDGRFNEQKYRLKRSGAEKVFYIIEEYSKEDAMNFNAQAIQTAMSSTQVVDKFFLKRTATINDTIDYLVTMTKMIEQIFHNVTLYRIPDHTITRINYLEQKNRLGKHHHITYPLYSELNSKNDTLTLKDLYLRMLMTIRGVSAEKASALTKIYPTPCHLLRAYEMKSEDEGKALAREATKDAISRRRWGQQLSEKLWEVWGQGYRL